MNTKSATEYKKSTQTTSGSAQMNQANIDSSNPPENAVTKEIKNIERLRKLVEGPEPLWPIPVPDEKQVTNLK
ncbi:hypothetical protein [Nitrosomonas aestuarii]|uniref:hypothetical protein n=1 Tax=Nitrosomonas aestuarii TaxID=52441 RepID=UPI000D324BBA|nr:hypothetical protein [Nitrosomonas aestuarii]